MPSREKQEEKQHLGYHICISAATVLEGICNVSRVLERQIEW